jgi:aspartate aminotransferase
MFGEPGAEILYPDPGFPIYRSMIEFTGAAPVPVPIREEPTALPSPPRRRWR